jgi:DNA polymerase (family X)
MPIHNREIARIFNHIADLLEIRGSNPFRVRAYRNAARTIEDQPQSLASMLEEKADLTEIAGIGDDLAGKIAEIVETGSLTLLRKLEAEVPGKLSELLHVAQLGPKRIAALHRELGIDDLDELAAAARAHKIRDLEGFGEKLEATILEDLERRAGREERIKLAAAEEVAEALRAFLAGVEGVEKVAVAGSFRRRRETVGDLDILVTCTAKSPVMAAFTGYEDVAEVLAKGATKSSVRLRDGLQVDLRVVEKESYGAALYYFTGSKEHNIAIRQIAVKRGLKLNEYGIFRDGDEGGGKRIAGASEAEVFAAVGLPFIEPELRENRGEIEAAQKGKLPQLVVRDDLRGDLHAHTEATDGHASLRAMVEAARGLGYSYLAITEHSQAVTVARGLNRKRLEKQIAEIEALSDAYSGFRILKGIEVDILEDGSLDLPDAVLAKLDLTVCSIHSKFDLSAEQQTERIIRAMDNPHFKILGHPTGRLIGERDPYRVDMERLMRAAVERGCFFEVNAHPDRLDLNDHHCRMAKELGLKVAINTDAHSTRGLENIRFGVYQARRGWLERDDVINTRKVAELLRLLQR